MPAETVGSEQEPTNNNHPMSRVGDKVGGDKITVGNISDSYTAIGAGAQVIVNQVQQALSSVDELEKSIQAAERRLAESIQKKITVYTKLTAADSIDARSNPYKALLDYKLEDAPFFYGRIQALTAMQQKMGNSRLTILHSDSGSGKTSLLQAGLASRLLAEGHFPLYLRPYDQPPAQYIKKAFLPDYATQPELARFADDQMTLHGFLGRITHYLGKRRLIIFLDQFEEFFTELNADQQQTFAAQLRACVESDLSVWWVLALRKEYFSDLRLFQPLKPFENEYFLPTFKVEEAQDVIIEPAALKGVAYEVGLVDQILTDIRQQADVIPPAQVQLVCYTLFDELTTQANPTLISTTLYNKPRGRGDGAPGAEGILSSHLSRVLDRELKGQERRVAGKVLEALVTSDLRRAQRSQASLENVVSGEQAALLDNVLEILYANRLVRRELDEDDLPVYELAHDYLLNEIELDPETQARKAAQELLAQEVRAFQLHGTLLGEDKFSIINSQKEYLTIDETAAELLKKSEKVIEAERRQEIEQAQKLAEEQRLRAEEGEKAAQRLRQRLILATIAVVIAFMAFGAAVWFGQQSQKNANFAATKAAEAETEAQNAQNAQATAIVDRNEAQRQTNLAQARVLAAQSEQALEGDYRLGLRYAYKSAALTHDIDGTLTSEAHAALQNALSSKLHDGILFGHTRWVRTAEFSPDGMRVVTASDDGTARLWDTDGQPLAVLEGHTASVWTAEFSPDGTRVVTASDDGTVRLWDADGQPLAVLEGHTDWVRTAAFSPDGTRVVTASGDGTARLWDADGQPLAILKGHTASVWTAEFSPDGTRVITAGEDGTARLWDADGQMLAVLEGHTEWVRMATFNSDGTRIVTASGNDDTARLWDADGQMLTVLEGHTEWVRMATFNSDGTRIVTASEDGTARLWDTDGQPLAVLEGHTDEVLTAAFSPDGTRVVTASKDGTARLWDADGQPLAVLEGHTSLVRMAVFSPDGTRVVTASFDDTARRWNADGQPLSVLARLTDDIWTAFSPDGTRTVTVSEDGTARLRDADGQPLAVLEGHTASVWTAEFSYDGTRVVTASEDGTARLWNADGQPLAILKGHTSLVRMAEFSYDGTRVVTASEDGTARLWDADGQPLAVLKGHTSVVNMAAFSPDDMHVVTASEDHTARLWDADGRSLAVLKGHTSVVNMAAFSPDGTRVVTASLDGTARLWDADGQPLAVLEGHTASVWTAEFSYDGTRVVTASFDGTARLWDADGQPLAVLTGHTSDIRTAWFSPDGTRVITANGDHTVRMWIVYPSFEAMLAAAKRRLVLLLDLKECQTLFELDTCAQRNRVLSTTE